MIDVKNWFADFTKCLYDDPSRRGEILEVLSDAANEYYCNAVTAIHLRRYGRKLASGGLFWVRSEWEKTDLSYGLAKAAFAEWRRAWPHDTGDLGQIEAKVLYAHCPPGGMRPRIQELRTALDARRSRDTVRHGAAYVARQQYHAIVWLFDHGKNEKWNGAEAEGRASDLMKKDFGELLSPFVVVAREDLRGLWPLASHEDSYTPELRVALARLM